MSTADDCRGPLACGDRARRVTICMHPAAGLGWSLAAWWILDVGW